MGKIYLFGSRVNDSKRGGDIDLYLIPNIKESLQIKKIKFLLKLNMILGEQKIDIVISNDINRSIEVVALNEGILL